MRDHENHETDQQRRYLSPVGSGSTIHVFSPARAPILAHTLDDSKLDSTEVETTMVLMSSKARAPTSPKKPCSIPRDESKGTHQMFAMKTQGCHF